MSFLASAMPWGPMAVALDLNSGLALTLVVLSTSLVYELMKMMITFSIWHSRLYIYASVCVCLSLAAFPHYCTDPDVTLGNGRGCPSPGLIVMATNAPNAKRQRGRLYNLYGWY